ncbi:Putative lipid-transfer protein DIR1 [Apostasia shenzhenica]|uniref:Lipid-transfer protein DIR1 n=1 Tax=Apostasia shenzhenica TaxID=1088818 RepID=A0A2H9ZZ86_9ASPA|nr:Putative lipid-transfer protein DIR1 [Apostasia shenzhenica]
MAEKKSHHLLALQALVSAALLLSSSVLPEAAAQPTKVCNMSRDGFAACRPAISLSAPTPAPVPTDACCSAVAGADLTCLCGYKNSVMLPYLGINPNLAMQLPAKCHVPAPSNC